MTWKLNRPNIDKNNEDNLNDFSKIIWKVFWGFMVLIFNAFAGFRRRAASADPTAPMVPFVFVSPCESM